ncbi:MAG: HD domain-containing protein [Bdellovibrio sp.]|nr:HD domain-containing protein [Bdellovibrio sp.]
MAHKKIFTEALEDVYSDRLKRKDGFVEVPTSVFIEKVDVYAPDLPNIDFYILKENKFEVLKSAQESYSPLVLSMHDYIWIKEEYIEHVRSHVEGIILKPNDATNALPSGKRMEILRRSAIKVVENLFEKPSPEKINKSIKVVKSFVFLIMKDPKAYLLLTRLSSHDPYTLQHSVGTAVNAIILGKKLKIDKETELNDLGLAGLLHDIGKVRVRKEIINKAGPLTEEEWEEIKKHSREGYEIVKDNSRINFKSKRAILEHHESRNGTGYPQVLKAHQIDLYSKIISICDIFNAITSDRSYAKAKPIYDAFDFMKNNLEHKIDMEIFKELVLIYGGKI